MRNKFVKSIVYCFIFLMLSVMIYVSISGIFLPPKSITLLCRCSGNDNFQVFYLTRSEGCEYSEARSVWNKVAQRSDFGRIHFSLPADALMGRLRLDIGQTPGSVLEMKQILIFDGDYYHRFECDAIAQWMVGDHAQLINCNKKDTDDGVGLISCTDDPSVVFFLDDVLSNVPWWDSFRLRVALGSVVAALLLTLLIYRHVYLKDFIQISRDIWSNRVMVLNLAINDFSARYVGSYLGVIWAFIQPVTTIAVYCFVFQVGLKSSAVNEMPFSLWLTSGLIAWFFFSEAWLGCTNVFLEYSYIVKKVMFKLDIMPVFKILSFLFTHILFVSIVMVIFVANGLARSAWVLQIIYYMFALACLVTGLGLLTSSIMVFTRDVGQVLGIILQFGMWMTPILWHITAFPEAFIPFFKLNPMYYIVDGYRKSYTATHFFMLDDPSWTVYYWLVTILIICLSVSIFRRLKHHFADVL